MFKVAILYISMSAFIQNETLANCQLQTANFLPQLKPQTSVHLQHDSV